MAPKKQKQKMSLGDFLADEATGGSWADEMDSLPTAPAARDEYGDRVDGPSPYARGGDRRDRDFDRPQRAEVPLPTAPPYTTFVGNLGFDVTEDEISAYFDGLEVTSVRIMKSFDDKPKGFGYVEFGSLDSLKTALTRSGGSLGGRTLRVTVAEPPKKGFGGGGGFDDDKTSGEWRRSGPLPAAEPPRRSGFGGPSRFDSDGPIERGSKFAPREDAPLSAADETRDWRGAARGPPPPPASQGRQAPPHEGREPRSFGFGGASTGAADEPTWQRGANFRSAPPPVERRAAPPREPTAADTEETWSKGSKFQPAPAVEEREQRKGFGAGFRRGGGADSPAPADEPTDWRSAPRKNPAGSEPSGPPQRKKLELAARSNTPSATASPSASPPASSKASPFGAARAVNTAAREEEVAARRAREAEEKEKADKAKAAASSPTSVSGDGKPIPTGPRAQPQRKPSTGAAPPVRKASVGFSFAAAAGGKRTEDEEKNEEEAADEQVEKVAEKVGEVKVEDA